MQRRTETGRWRRRSFVDDFLAARQRAPEKTAVVSRRAGSHEATRFTYAELGATAAPPH